MVGQASYTYEVDTFEVDTYTYEVDTRVIHMRTYTYEVDTYTYEVDTISRLPTNIRLYSKGAV